MNRTLILILVTALFSCRKSEPNFEGGTSSNDIREEKVVMAPQVANQENQIIQGELVLASPKETAGSLNRERSIERKIVKTGNLSFESDDISKTRKEIITATKLYEGYISKDQESGYENDQKEYMLSIRVPAIHFDALLTKISSQASRIISKNINVEDITSRYYDHETRLNNKKQLETRYLQLLNKATAISDMLKIENKLAEIRAEIESAEGEFRIMQQQIAYSTLNLTFYSKSIEVEHGQSFFEKLSNSFGEAMDRISELFFWLVSVSPLLLIFIVVAIVAKRKLFRRKNAGNS